MSSDARFVVASRQGDYEVSFHGAVSEAVAELARVPDAFVVVDARVASLYASPLAPLLASRPTLAVVPTEEEKTLDGVRRVVSWLRDGGANQRSTVVAIGGGIVQDLATFSAHVYHRGLRWRFLPTTLLAMSDSCIGAKCGINLGEFKNQLGVFHSPSGVLVCTEFIRTLEERDVVSGYGEILKLMLTGSARQYESLRDAVERDGFRNARLESLVKESLLVKKAVIEDDEYEADRRRILNFGHTFGHALEAATRYEVAHGTAVAWGVGLANHISRRRGLLSDEWHREIDRFVRARFWPGTGVPVSADDLLRHARKDKKAAAGAVNLILCAEPGDLRIVPTPFDDQLRGDVADYLGSFDAPRRD